MIRTFIGRENFVSQPSFEGEGKKDEFIDFVLKCLKIVIDVDAMNIEKLDPSAPTAAASGNFLPILIRLKALIQNQ